MDTSGINKPLGLANSSKIAFLLVIAILLWSVGAPALMQKAHAANVTTVSDTLSTSNLNANAKHTIRFTTASSVGTGQTIKIGFDSNAYGGTSAFTEAFSAATSTNDIFFGTSTYNGYQVIPSTTACSGTTNQVQVVGNYNGGTDENLIFTMCAGPTPLTATTSVQIAIGSTTALITNPAVTGSYRVNVNVGNATSDAGETRVAVLQNVTLTASVSTTFTFTVAGLATSTGLGLAGGYSTTTASSTATALPFSTLAPGVSTILGQQLTVASNARNGFSVTVQENQPPTSSTGATIDLFNNGATSTYPTAWTGPTSVLDVPSTYGHFGITSDDADEGTSTNANEFGGGNLWAGNIDQPRVVFSHTGPSDGIFQNKGAAKVGFRIQIGALQEAGNDYTNTITYVATPTF
jgi:hypothetical protein